MNPILATHAAAALTLITGVPCTAYRPETGENDHVIVVPDSVVWAGKSAVLHYAQVQTRGLTEGRVTVVTDHGSFDSGEDDTEPMAIIADRIAAALHMGRI